MFVVMMFFFLVHRHRCRYHHHYYYWYHHGHCNHHYHHHHYLHTYVHSHHQKHSHRYQNQHPFSLCLLLLCLSSFLNTLPFSLLLCLSLLFISQKNRISISKTDLISDSRKYFCKFVRLEAGEFACSFSGVCSYMMLASTTDREIHAPFRVSILFKVQFPYRNERQSAFKNHRRHTHTDQGIQTHARTRNTPPHSSSGQTLFYAHGVYTQTRPNARTHSLGLDFAVDRSRAGRRPSLPRPLLISAISLFFPHFPGLYRLLLPPLS